MKKLFPWILLFLLISLSIFIHSVGKENFENNLGESVRSLLFMEIDYPVTLPPELTTRPPQYKPVSFTLNPDGTVPDEVARQILVNQGILTANQPLPQDPKTSARIAEIKKQLLIDISSAYPEPPVPRDVPQIYITTPSGYDKMSKEELGKFITDANNYASIKAKEIGNAQRANDNLSTSARPFDYLYSS
jgi:hypothetical protein